MIEIKECEFCEGTTRGDTCFKAVVCPSCQAAPGRSCIRPSGHKASEIHADRIKAAQALDDAAGFNWREAYGVSA